MEIPKPPTEPRDDQETALRRKKTDEIIQASVAVLCLVSVFLSKFIGFCLKTHRAESVANSSTYEGSDVNS